MKAPNICSKNSNTYSKNHFPTMNQNPISHQSQQPALQPAQVGKDEMNLAEFPLTKLGTRDKRDVLVYEGWHLDEGRGPCRQVWTVRGAAGLGLPNELGDRVVLALI